MDLESALPQTTVMVVSVTGSTTSGQPPSEQDLQECLKVMGWMGRGGVGRGGAGLGGPRVPLRGAARRGAASPMSFVVALCCRPCCSSWIEEDGCVCVCMPCPVRTRQVG